MNSLKVSTYLGILALAYILVTPPAEVDGQAQIVVRPVVSWAVRRGVKGLYTSGSWFLYVLLKH